MTLANHNTQWLITNHARRRSTNQISSKSMCRAPSAGKSNEPIRSQAKTRSGRQVGDMVWILLLIGRQIAYE